MGVPRFVAKERAARAAHLKKAIEDRRGFDEFIKHNYGYSKKKRSDKVKAKWNDVVSIGILPSLDNYSSLSENEEARRKANKDVEDAMAAAEGKEGVGDMQHIVTPILVVPGSRQSCINSRDESARPKSVRWIDEQDKSLTTGGTPQLLSTKSNPERQTRLSPPSKSAMRTELSVISLDSIPSLTPEAWTESDKYPSTGTSKRQAKLQPPSFASMLAKNEEIKQEKASRNEKNEMWVNEYVESWGFRTPSPRALSNDTVASTHIDEVDVESEKDPVEKQKPSEIYSLKTEINRLQTLMHRAKKSENATKLPSVGLRKVLQTVEKRTPSTRQEKPMRGNKYTLVRVQEDTQEEQADSKTWTSRSKSRTERERGRWAREEAPSRGGSRRSTMAV